MKIDSIKSIDEGWIPENKIKFRRIFNISAKTNYNVEDLCQEFRDTIDILDEKKRGNIEVAAGRQALNNLI